MVATTETRESAPVVLVSPCTRAEVVEILKAEVDDPPRLWRSLVSLNATYFRGSAAVCGLVTESRCDLRRRSGPGFSVRAVGEFVDSRGGTEIRLRFSGPACPLPRLFVDTETSRDAILRFLKESLRATVMEPMTD